jgi:hypothetical protein
MPTLTVYPHASNYPARDSATPFTFPGGRYGIGCGGQRIVFGIIHATLIDDQDRAYAEDCNRADAFRGF